MAKPGVVCFPSTFMGHLISMVELAKKLQPSFSVTILIVPHMSPAWASATTAYVESVTSSGLDIHFEELPSQVVPPPRLEVEVEVEKPETFFTRLMEAYRSPAKAAISARNLSSPPNIAAIIFDLFSTSMIDMGDELGIPAYIFYTSSAAMLGTMLYLPTLHVKIPCEMRDVEGDIDVPGLPPVPPLYMPCFMMDKKHTAYTIFVNHSHWYSQAKGIIVNTFADLEPKPLHGLANGDYLPDHPTPPVFPVGPLLSVEPSRSSEHECIKWLDRQPKASVVFLCFGSMVAFEAPQVKEIAVGLERSGHRFLWALRRPSSSDMFRMPTDANLNEVLPEGFLAETRQRGLVWPSWVPQGEILSHDAIGGFMTHCGWNSCLESLWFGVPMLGWPNYAEQHLNCLQMVKDVGVALELKTDYYSGGFATSEEIERGVRLLMEDGEERKKVGAKVEEIKVASRNAITKDGGSSYAALERLMGELKQNPHIANYKEDNF